MIDINKKYKTRDGSAVRIYATDGGGNYPVHGAIGTGGYWTQGSWKLGGVWTLDDDIPHNLDLVEVTPWDDFKIDDKVLVRGEDSPEWERRYFAGVSPEGKPMAFMNGADSWSSKATPMEWDECIHWTEDAE